MEDIRDFKDILGNGEKGKKNQENCLYIKINMKGKSTETIIRILNDIAQKVADGHISEKDDVRFTFK